MNKSFINIIQFIYIKFYFQKKKKDAANLLKNIFFIHLLPFLLDNTLKIILNIY